MNGLPPTSTRFVGDCDVFSKEETNHNNQQQLQQPTIKNNKSIMVMLFKSVVSSIVLMSIVAPICSFTVNNVGNYVADLEKVPRRSQYHEISLHMSSTDFPIGRRDAIKNSGSLLIFSSIFSLSDTAEAKDKEPVYLDTVRSSFQAVRDELVSGGITNLGVLVENEDYDQIMEFTKEYDLEFRKAKMGKARKFLTSKEDKDKAVLLCNAVTFDLIGMNKGCRAGQRNIEQVRKYYTELKVDIQSFLDLEKNIDVSEYIS